MTTTRFMLTVCALVLCAFAFTSTSYAQTAQRTFVSTQGDDANTASLCGRNTPCRGFTAAISVVSAGGEVIALDSGGYGAVTINKSVQITAPTGVYVAITATSGNAITIATGASDTVVLRGLTLNSLGANTGIDFQTGRTLHVESCVVNGFSIEGIRAVHFAANDTSEVFIKDTIVRNGGGYGILLSSIGSGSLMRASIDNCRVERNGIGLSAISNVRVTVRGSVAANNGNGFVVQTNASSATTEFNLESCIVTNNTSSGLYAISLNGGAAIMRVSNSTITNNVAGISLSGLGSQVLTRGNNTVEGNTNGNTFPAGSTYTAK